MKCIITNVQILTREMRNNEICLQYENLGWKIILGILVTIMTKLCNFIEFLKENELEIQEINWELFLGNCIRPPLSMRIQEDASHLHQNAWTTTQTKEKKNQTKNQVLLR